MPPFYFVSFEILVIFRIGCNKDKTIFSLSNYIIVSEQIQDLMKHFASEVNWAIKKRPDQKPHYTFVNALERSNLVTGRLYRKSCCCSSLFPSGVRYSIDPYTSSCAPPTVIERGDKFVDQTVSPVTRIQMQNSLDFFKMQNATVQYVGKARVYSVTCYSIVWCRYEWCYIYSIYYTC